MEHRESRQEESDNQAERNERSEPRIDQRLVKLRVHGAAHRLEHAADDDKEVNAWIHGDLEMLDGLGTFAGNEVTW